MSRKPRRRISSPTRSPRPPTAASEAKGKLTIRDKTQPVTLKVKFAENGNAATLDVDTTLKRADYGLGAGKDWSDVGADVPVHGHLILSAK